ncbi:hypothetical protein [Nocardia suismassiliense]|uniref:hypothetical protein n=1 Tax=Nocardia suismassiliense TaxID=2077092 RepID=UPI00131F0AFC|nr:hypothetical protein [Nocardia suismassiliense]
MGDMPRTSCTENGSFHYPWNKFQNTAGPLQYITSPESSADNIEPDRILHKMTHEIPALTQETIIPQRKLHLISNYIVAFAGSYVGDASHEASFAAGVEAARIASEAYD